MRAIEVSRNLIAEPQDTSSRRDAPGWTLAVLNTLAALNSAFFFLARLKSGAPANGIHRVDLHARTSRDGRLVSVDSSHEGLGRQMYIAQIGHILDHPPAKDAVR